MSSITSDDMDAQGFEIVDGVARRKEQKPAPVSKDGVVIGFDPSLIVTGAAALNLRTGKWMLDEVKPPKKLREDVDVPIDKEHRLLDIRLRYLRAWTKGYTNTARMFATTTAHQAPATTTAIVEGAYHRGSQASPESIIKYGMAVASVVAGAAQATLATYIVPPDWTKDVLVSRTGKASKPQRWQGAIIVLQSMGYEWPLPKPGEIKERSSEEHMADAATLVAAWLASR